MISPGKQFEKDFQSSCEKVMSYIRLNDPASSFNLECTGCPKQKTRFAPRHLCDAIAYKYPNQYLFELKSTKQKSVPFKNIVKNEKDKRLQKMVNKSNRNGVIALIIFNFRYAGNHTYAVSAKNVLNFINSPSRFGYPDSRKSIPFLWASDFGIKIGNHKKIVHFSYMIEDIFRGQL